MKRLIFLMMLAVCTAAWSQSPIEFGEKTKRINMASAEKGDILMETSDGIIALVPDTRNILGVVSEKGDWHLGLWGFDGNPIKEVVVPRKEAGKCFSRIVDDKLYVLYPSGSAMMRLVVNPKTLEIISKGGLEGIHVYVNSDVEREVNARFKIATTSEYAVSASPNGDFYVIANRHFNNRMIALLDETFELLWVKSDLDYSDAVRVDNEGNVYQILARVDSERQTSQIKFMRMDVDNETEEVVGLPFELYDISLLNVIDGRIVALGLVCSDQGKRREKYRTCDRVVGLTYDFDKRQFNSDIQNISSDALNVLGNISTKKTNKAGKADMLSLTQSQPTSYGGVCLMQRGWGKEVRNVNTGVSSYSYIVCGQVMVSVDADGKIRWQRPFRQFMEEPFRDQCRTIPLLIVEEDNTYLVIPQEKISKNGYDIKNPIHTTVLPRNSFYLAIFRVDASGNVTVKSNGKKDQELLDAAVKTKGERYVCFYSSTGKGGFAYLQL